MKPNALLDSTIQDEIARRDAFLCVMSADANSSHWVQQELSWASYHQASNGKPVIIPVLAERSSVPAIIADRMKADFTDLQNYHPRLQELIAAIKVVKRRPHAAAGNHEPAGAEASIWDPKRMVIEHPQRGLLMVMRGGAFLLMNRFFLQWFPSLAPGFPVPEGTLRALFASGLIACASGVLFAISAALFGLSFKLDELAYRRIKFIGRHRFPFDSIWQRQYAEVPAIAPRAALLCETAGFIGDFLSLIVIAIAIYVMFIGVA